MFYGTFAVYVEHVPMQKLFDLVSVNPWSLAAGVIVVVGAILAEVFGKGVQGADFPDAWDD